MVPQIVTTPMNPNAAIKSLTAKAAHNGQWMAVLLEWKDSTKSGRIVLDEFGDQVAVERPVHYKKNALPSPMMAIRVDWSTSGSGAPLSSTTSTRANLRCVTCTPMLTSQA